MRETCETTLRERARCWLVFAILVPVALYLAARDAWRGEHQTKEAGDAD